MNTTILYAWGILVGAALQWTRGKSRAMTAVVILLGGLGATIIDATLFGE